MGEDMPEVRLERYIVVTTGQLERIFCLWAVLNRGDGPPYCRKVVEAAEEEALEMAETFLRLYDGLLENVQHRRRGLARRRPPAAAAPLPAGEADPDDKNQECPQADI